MPTGFFDCFGFSAWIRNNDGTFVPVDLSQAVTISADDTGENEWSIGTADASFTLETRINRALMRLIYPARELRRQIRRMEKERRRRLKEGQHGN